MAIISFQKPTDQPTGNARLLRELEVNLAAADLTEFSFMVAFAKLGPLTRLSSTIRRWRSQGKVIKAIMGIDG